jgi:hypothetical protein
MKKVIETGKVIVAGFIIGAIAKGVIYAAVKAAKAKAASADDVITVKRVVDYTEIPAEIRAKLEQQ